MPDLDALLAETMLFAGSRGAGLEPVPVVLGEGAFTSPKPRPQTMAEVGTHERDETAMANYVWRFRWDPARPGTFTDVTIKTRGMGMDYGMAASVFDRVEFESVRVVRDTGAVDLPLDAAHMVKAWWTRTGEIGPKASRLSPLWKLPAKLDSSLVVCFAYQLDGGSVKPLTMTEIQDLGDDLIPVDGRRPAAVTAGDAESYDVCIGPARYIVMVELVLCRERPDFVPGNLVGFCRIHPHVLAWSNEDLQRFEASIVLERPAKGMQCDPAMDDEIGSLAVSDTNDAHSASAMGGLPLPYTDNLYDYYNDDPHGTFGKRKPQDGDHPLQRIGEITLADARFRDERTNHGCVERRTPLVRNVRDVRKCPRQGQFDNVHLAARMVAEFADEHGDPVDLGKIVMINMCLHDCVHMHVRWGEFLEDKMLLGWGPRGPFTKAGAPAIPPNQTVFASFPNRHTLRYRAVAETCRAGALQIVCHHGCAYAVDAWPDGHAFMKIAGLHTAIAAEAVLHDQPHRGQIPFGWLEFYWRVRWTGVHGQPPVERLTFELEKAMR